MSTVIKTLKSNIEDFENKISYLNDMMVDSDYETSQFYRGKIAGLRIAIERTQWVLNEANENHTQSIEIEGN